MFNKLIKLLNDHAEFISNELIGRPQPIPVELICTKCTGRVYHGTDHICTTRHIK